jgi:hypothetical protein
MTLLRPFFDPARPHGSRCPRRRRRPPPPRPPALGRDNQFPMMWVCAIAIVLESQAFWLLRRPGMVTARPALPWVWRVYAAFMAATGFTILVCYCIALPVQAAWVVLWYPSIVVIAWGTWFHCYSAQQQQQAPAAAAPRQAAALPIHKPGAAEPVDEPQPGAFMIPTHAPQPLAEAVEPQQAAPAGGDSGAGAADASAAGSQQSGAGARGAWAAAQVLGWSSLAWMVFLAFFLTIQVRCLCTQIAAADGTEATSICPSRPCPTRPPPEAPSCGDCETPTAAWLAWPAHHSALGCPAQAGWLASDAQRYPVPSGGQLIAVRTSGVVPPAKKGQLAQAAPDCEAQPCTVQPHASTPPARHPSVRSHVGHVSQLRRMPGRSSCLVKPQRPAVDLCIAWLPCRLPKPSHQLCWADRLRAFHDHPGELRQRSQLPASPCHNRPVQQAWDGASFATAAAGARGVHSDHLTAGACHYCALSAAGTALVALPVKPARCSMPAGGGCWRAWHQFGRRGSCARRRRAQGLLLRQAGPGME